MADRQLNVPTLKGLLRTAAARVQTLTLQKRDLMRRMLKLSRERRQYRNQFNSVNGNYAADQLANVQRAQEKEQLTHEMQQLRRENDFLKQNLQMKADLLATLQCNTFKGAEATVSQQDLAQQQINRDVFLMIRCQQTTIFMIAKESTIVFELKQMLQGITKKAPGDIWLYKEEIDQEDGTECKEILEDNKNLGDSGITSSTARAQAPATIGIVQMANEGGVFEELTIDGLSTPPELPHV